MGSVIMIVIAVITITMMVIAIVERLQEVPEGPRGHMPALAPRHSVRRAEADALEDAGLDQIRGCIRKSVICARLLDGQRVIARQSEGHLISPEKERKRTGHDTRNLVGT